MKQPIINSSEVTADTAILHFTLPPDCEAFQGHFPNFPVLPGVVQMDWALRLANEYLKTPHLSATNFRVKFNHIISPNMDLVLKLVLINDRLDFSYHKGDEKMSSGQIKL